jgi:hypothetical protein
MMMIMCGAWVYVAPHSVIVATTAEREPPCRVEGDEKERWTLTVSPSLASRGPSTKIVHSLAPTVKLHVGRSVEMVFFIHEFGLPILHQLAFQRMTSPLGQLRTQDRRQGIRSGIPLRGLVRPMGHPSREEGLFHRRGLPREGGATHKETEKDSKHFCVTISTSKLYHPHSYTPILFYPTALWHNL